MKRALLLTTLVAACATSQATITIATFADPASGSATPMFRYNATLGTIRADWLTNGLTLEHPGFIGGGSTADVKMRMNPLTLTAVIPGAVFTSNAGAINFWTTSEASPIFTITFSSAVFTFPVSLGSADFQANNVAFSGPNVPSGLSQEQFGFSFANVVPTQSGNGYTMSSSFTSSAVPEPASLAVLGLGLLAIRRKK